MVCTIHQPSIEIFEVTAFPVPLVQQGLCLVPAFCKLHALSVGASIPVDGDSSCFLHFADSFNGADKCSSPQAFDDLLLLKRGGKVIYNGPTGKDSADLVRYFEGIEGVSKLQEGINPATWMLEISTVSAEERLGRDFAEIYAESDLFRYRTSSSHVQLLR